MSSDLHDALLRPAILHILRATGFHSIRPLVLDSLTSLAGRHLQLLAERAAYHAQENQSSAAMERELDVTDVRMAMQDVGILVPGLTSAEEAWREALRRPLDTYSFDRVRRKERERRDEQDTEDVRAFVAWAQSDAYKEIRRVAGLLPDAKEGDAAATAAAAAAAGQDDKAGDRVNYLAALKKKHSKTGEEARFQGTVLGKAAEEKQVKVEGGEFESLSDWNASARGRSLELAAKLKKLDSTRADVTMMDAVHETIET